MARRSNQPSRPVKIVDILLWVGIVLGLAGVFGIEENEGKVFFGVIGVAALLLYIRRVSRKQTALESTNQQTSPVAPYNQQNKMNAPTGSNQVALDTREVLPKFGLTKYETGIKELCNAARTAFIAFDFETTGLKSEIHCITEIGAIKYENGIETARFHSLINPKQPIPDEVSRITGITDAMVSNAPLVETVLPSFLSFINGYLLVAHNASFDLAFLDAALRRCNLIAHVYYADTLAIAKHRMLRVKSYSLSGLAVDLQLKAGTAHRALGDCETVAALVMYLTQSE